ncbi:Adenosinetriphosphatase [Bertholletia excelsa]
MEVKVKPQLQSSEAHKKILSPLSPFRCRTHSFLSPFHRRTPRQQNTFGSAIDELSSRQAVLRLQFYNDDPSASSGSRPRP